MSNTANRGRSPLCSLSNKKRAKNNTRSPLSCLSNRKAFMEKDNAKQSEKKKSAVIDDALGNYLTHSEFEYELPKVGKLIIEEESHFPNIDYIDGPIMSVFEMQMIEFKHDLSLFMKSAPAKLSIEEINEKA